MSCLDTIWVTENGYTIAGGAMAQFLNDALDVTIVQKKGN